MSGYLWVGQKFCLCVWRRGSFPMNIFLLALAIADCARAHCDAHVVKMITETTQLLFYAHHLLQPRHVVNEQQQETTRECATTDWKVVYQEATGYEPYLLSQRHAKHPMTLWVCSSQEKYMHAANLGLALCDEYWKRYGHCRKPQPAHHKCRPMLEWLRDNPPPRFDDSWLLTSKAAERNQLAFDGLPSALLPFPLCVSVDVDLCDPIGTYRRFYEHKLHVEKKKIVWSHCDPPVWFSLFVL